MAVTLDLNSSSMCNTCGDQGSEPTDYLNVGKQTFKDASWKTAQYQAYLTQNWERKRKILRKSSMLHCSLIQMRNLTEPL